MSCSQKDFEAKKARRHRRKLSIRRRIFGTKARPRLTVFRSHKNIYCQIVDDMTGVTLASASTRAKDVSGDVEGFGGNSGAAVVVGKAIAAKALELGIENVLFDRNGY